MLRHSLLATSFSSVKILKSCKKQEGCQDICIKVASVDKEYVSHLGGLLCLSQTHSFCIISSPGVWLWQQYGVLFQHELSLLIFCTIIYVLNPNAFFPVSW